MASRTLVLLSIPVIQNQIATLSVIVPDIYNTLIQKLNWLMLYLGIQDTLNQASVEQIVRDNFSQTGGVALWLWRTTVTSSKAVVSIVIDVILIPFLTYYLLRDWDLVTEKFEQMIPHRIRSSN